MGELLRRYWHPIGLMGDATDTPKKVRALGEDLVLLDGRVSGGTLHGRVRDCVARLREADLGALASAGSGGARPGLSELLDGLVADLQGLAAAVEAAHFPAPAPPRQLPAGLGWGAS